MMLPDFNQIDETETAMPSLGDDSLEISSQGRATPLPDFSAYGTKATRPVPRTEAPGFYYRNRHLGMNPPARDRWDRYVAPRDTPPESGPKLDLSAFGTRARAPGDVPLPRPRPDEAPPAAVPFSDYPAEFGKGVVAGAKNLVASSLKGLAGVRADRPSFAPGQSPLELAMRGDDAAFDQYLAGPQEPPQPITNDPIYQAGQAVEDLGKSALAPRPGFEPGQSWTRDIGSGFGSVAAGIATYMIPGIGPSLAGGMFVTSGMGEATDKAVQNKATPEQIAQAARFGTVAGATDIVDALLPMLGSTGKTLGFVKRVGLAAVGGAVAEGGQEGLQQFIQNAIAKGIYKPDQDMFEDVPRSVAIGAIVGGTTAGGFSAMQGTQPKTNDDPVVRADIPVPPQAPGRTVEPIRPAETPVDSRTVAAPASVPPSGTTAPAAPPSEPSIEPDERAEKPAVLTGIEQRVLRKLGYTDEMIRGMNRSEIEAELGAAEIDEQPSTESELLVPSPIETAQDQAMPDRPEMIAPNANQSMEARPDFSDQAPPTEGAGTRANPAKINDAADIERVAEQINTGSPEALVGKRDVGADNRAAKAFDTETYAKAKPLFERAATKFAASKDEDATELVRRIVGEMQRAHGLRRDGIEAMRPYIKRFIEEVRSGVIKLGKTATGVAQPPKLDFSQYGTSVSDVGTRGSSATITASAALPEDEAAMQARRIDAGLDEAFGLSPQSDRDEGFQSIRRAPAPPEIEAGSHLSEAAQRSSAEIAAAVRGIVGDHYRVETPDRIPLSRGARGWGAAGQSAQTAAGTINDDLILIALNDPAYEGDPLSTAFHEAYHGVESRLLAPKELTLMETETPRLRKFLKRQQDLDLDGVNVDEIAGYEVRAIAFEIYAMRRATGQPLQSFSGIHIGVRRAFEKIREIAARIRNALNGLGFRTAKDVFSDVYLGKMRDRMPREARGEMQASFRRGRVAAPIGEPSRAERALHYAGDRMVRLKTVLQAVVQANPDLAIPDTYTTESLSYGRVNERLETLWREKVTPLMRDLRRAGVSLHDLSEYLYALDAENRNALIERRRLGDPRFHGSGSGMTNAEAASIRDSVAASGKQAAYDRLVEKVRDILRFNLDLRVSAGLMSRATADKWRRTIGASYVPWRGFEGDESSPRARTGSSRGPSGPESRSALGRSTKADNAILNAVNQVIEGVIRAEENRVRVSLYRLALADEASSSPTGVLQVVAAPERGERLDRDSGQIIAFSDTSYKIDEDVSVAKIDGKEVYVRINDKDLAKAMNDLFVHDPDGVLRVLARLTRFYSWMRTVGNPAFAPKNFARDVQDATIYAASHIDNGAALFAKHLPGALKDTTKYVWGATEDAEFRRFRISGGKVSYAQVRSLDQIRRRIERHMASPLHPANLLDQVKEPLEAWNDNFEVGVRYALYRAATEGGKSHDEAASIALEGTLNFYRRGAHGPVLDALIATQPFLNAHIQAPIRAGRLLRNSGRARAIYGALVPLGFAMAFANYMIGGDDDDGTPWYDKVAQHERLRNFLFYTGKKNALGEPEGFKIPTFPEVMLPAMLGQTVAAAMFGKRPIAEILGDLARAVQGLNPAENRELSIPFWSALGQIEDNRNFLGGPIHPNVHTQMRSVPKSEIKFKNTDENWQRIARWLAIAGGGDREKKPAIRQFDLHPEDVRHLARDLAGGWYSIAEYGAHLFGVKPKRGDGLPPVLKDFTLQGGAHRAYDREKLREERARDEARTLLLKERFDPKDANARERQLRRKQSAEEIGAAGGVVGPRGGLRTRAGQVFEAADAELGHLRQQLSITEAMPNVDRAVADALRKRISDATKRYRQLAEDVATGKIDPLVIRRELARRQRLLRSSTEIDPLKNVPFPGGR